MRALPPAALDGRVVRRIGVVGRAPEDAELEVGLVDAVTGAALTPAARVSVAAADAFATHWADVPDQPPLSRPASVSVRATSGRFLWVAADHPLAKIAIADPDWPGRAVTLGGVALTLPEGVASSHLPGASLPAVAFTGATPMLHSDLFLTVDAADLVLRYAR